jgi:hypothetical protein
MDPAAQMPASVPMPTTLSPTAPDGMADPAAMMPPVAEEIVSSVVTPPGDADGDDTLQDLPLQP